MLRRVGRKNLTVLFGQSGLGKSSLLQAGLFPRLRAEGYVPVAIRLDHAATVPSLAQQVITRVTRAIGDAGGQAEVTVSDGTETLWEFFHRRTLILQSADGRPIRPVFVFDQFEELFAIGQASEATRARAAQFVTELAELVENRVPVALERQLDDTPDLVKQFIFDDRDYRMLVCLREWLKTTKISPDVKVHVERFIHEMKGTPETLLELAARYEKATGVAVDLRKATHFCYLGHQKRGKQLKAERRFAEALPDLKEAAESAEADADDHNGLAICLGKLDAGTKRSRSTF